MHMRNKMIDIMRGILILLVVVGHSSFKYSSIIYWFHMPLFFILSGYVLRIPQQNERKAWIIRRVKKLLIPYFTYGIIIAIIRSLFAFDSIVSLPYYFAKLLIGGKHIEGVYWYITVLLTSEISIVYLYQLKKQHIYLITVILYCIAKIISMFYIKHNPVISLIVNKLPWNLDVCFAAIPYLIIGKEFSEKFAKWNKKLTGCNKNIIFCSIFVFIYIFAISFGQSYSLDMKNTLYYHYVLDLVIPVIFGSFLYSIAYGLPKWCGNFFAYIGQRSLVIMYLHLIVRDLIVIKLFGDNYSIILYVLIVIFLCMLIEKVLSQIPFSKFLL